MQSQQNLALGLDPFQEQGFSGVHSPANPEMSLINTTIRCCTLLLVPERRVLPHHLSLLINSLQLLLKLCDVQLHCQDLPCTFGLQQIVSSGLVYADADLRRGSRVDAHAGAFSPGDGSVNLKSVT